MHMPTDMSGNELGRHSEQSYNTYPHDAGAGMNNMLGPMGNPNTPYGMQPHYPSEHMAGGYPINNSPYPNAYPPQYFPQHPSAQGGGNYMHNSNPAVAVPPPGLPPLQPGSSYKYNQGPPNSINPNSLNSQNSYALPSASSGYQSSQTTMPYGNQTVNPMSLNANPQNPQPNNLSSHNSQGVPLGSIAPSQLSSQMYPTNPPTPTQGYPAPPPVMNPSQPPPMTPGQPGPNITAQYGQNPQGGGYPGSSQNPIHQGMNHPPSSRPDLNPTQNPPIAQEVTLTDHGTRLKLLGKLELAMKKYVEATKANSNYAPAFYNIGVIYSELGRYKEALEGYTSALQRNPYYVEAYCNIGVIYKNIGKLDTAVYYYDRALAVNPNFKIARNNMAIALTDLGTKLKNEGEIEESIKHYKKALVFNALYPDAYYNLGVAYGEQGMLDKAIVCYELGIHFNPLCCEAYNNLGVIFKDRDNLERATECYQSALQINAKFSQTLNNLGVVYTMQGKLDEAYKYVIGALEANPNYAEAYNNLGVFYRDEGKMAEAIYCYEKCLRLNPHSRNAAQNRLLALNYCNTDPHQVFIAHEEWGISFQANYKPYSAFNVELNPVKQLRIGYLSPDFFTHSVSYFIEGILEHHNKNNFLVYCYSNVVKEDLKTQYLRDFSTCWKSVYNKPTEEVAAMIQADKIDILVELTGHTAGNRLDVIAMKPAPIQITYIGYPNTTGLTTVDYRLCDEFTDPLNTSQEFTETLVRLPYCFLTYTPPPNAPPVLGLPALQRNFVTFGSFNNLAKITPQVLNVWATILNSIPNSRLVMKCKPFASQAVQNRILEIFAQKGISSSRIDLLPLMPRNYDHLKAYETMDISLDSWPYSGTTTTCESLYMGVPVISLKGDCHAHNVGLSLLNQVGLTDWIANREEDYVQIAIRESSNLERLQGIRSRLRSNMLESYLCDGTAFTKNLEQTYQKLWEKFVNNHS